MSVTASASRDKRHAVLVLGVYLVNQENTAAATIAEFNRSRVWAVDHQWLALGTGPIPEELAPFTVGTIESPVPKFVLLNQLAGSVALDTYRFVIVCDDDVSLPPEFLDDYLQLVESFDFALSQPARTHDSYMSHAFVEQVDGLIARRTRFVEIGPLFAVRQDAVPLVLPFDEESPMGWGYDFVWPARLESAGLKLGIIDATPIAHRIRKTCATYDYGDALRDMGNYLRQRPHVSKAVAFAIVESYALPPELRPPLSVVLRHRLRSRWRGVRGWLFEWPRLFDRLRARL